MNETNDKSAALALVLAAADDWDHHANIWRDSDSAVAAEAHRNAAILRGLSASYRDTFTDAEREAIRWAKGQAKLFPEFEAIRGHTEALRGLLERTGGER